MIDFLPNTHPREETLSRLADQSELELRRSLAGRHLLRCARCRAAVDSMRALGAAARALPVEPLPAGLWDRIAAATPAAPGDLHAGGAERLEGELPSPRPARSWRRRGLLAAGLAAAAVVILAWPALQRRDLAAADAERLTLLPRYPRPGTVLRARFVAPAGMPATDTLWLEGTFRIAERGGHEAVDELPVGVALVRAGGEYLGTLTVPEQALAGSLRLLHPRWPRARYRSIDGALVLTRADSAPRPSLDAMEDAVHGSAFWQQHVRLAAEFARWAPEHPMRWVLEPVRSRGGAFDWLGYFTSKERRFASLARALGSRDSLRAAELAGMTMLAYDIEEPEAAAPWTERLVREYPGSSWSLEMLVERIHALELREAPRDSIQTLVPLLDSLTARASRAPGDPWTLEGVIQRHGDARMLQRWARRTAHMGVRSQDLIGRRAALRDRELRDSVEAGARERLARIGSAPGPEAAATRAFAYGQLASVALARGEYRRVLALTDSTHVDSCRWIGRDTRALAYLALGDTAEAEGLLAPFAVGEWQGADSVRRFLGARAQTTRWARLVDSTARATRAARDCRG